MLVRDPAVAGMFYPSDPDACRREVAELFDRAAGLLAGPDTPALPGRAVGGIVPHAGYVFSGLTAALTFEALAAAGREPDVVVLFGAVHRSPRREAMLFDRGQWDSPLGPAEVDERLADRLMGNTNLIAPDPQAHESEHSLEVQLPLLRHRFPDAKILPIMVPPTRSAGDVGQAVARTLDLYDVDAVVIASTDLTHYGPRYGFTPGGVGPEGLAWAKENDRGVIDAIARLDAEAVVPETREKQNACGGGAIAAALAAARQMGATRGYILQHTTSYEAAGDRYGEQPTDAVGYLSAVLG